MGRPAQAYDDKGKLVWQVEFDIYGRIREDTFNNKPFIPFRQLGQYEDVETGLYYNRFRYYNSETGLYISQDPIGLAGNNPNFYAYVYDSNAWVDPFGLKKERKLWELTDKRSSQSKTIGNHRYYQHDSTGLWWSKDTAGHGGSAFKVFKEGKGRTLEWYRDADKYGDFIDPNKKHKGPVGKIVKCK